MFLFIFLFLAGMTLAEIYVLLLAGETFGVFPVVIAVVATALIGGAVIRWQGLKALHELSRASQEGTPPVQPVIDGIFLLVAAPFLMTPGFITDALGFLLLVPPIRHLIARYALQKIKKSIDEGKTSFTIRRF